MDYKEKYEMALEGIQEILSSGEDSIKMSRLQLRLQGIFPELKESEESDDERMRKYIISSLNSLLYTKGSQADKERNDVIAWLEKLGQIKSPISQHENKMCLISKDERIRAQLIEFFSGYNTDEEWWGSITEKDILAWLEKQGEQKPVNTVEPRFKINDKVIHKETGKTWTIHWYLADTNSYYVIDEEGLINLYSEDVLESAEQKSAKWIEEDERNFDIIYGIIYNSCNAEDASRLIAWLKSLRPQSTWKPSEGQMKALGVATNISNVPEKEYIELEKLYQDLKKLKG